MREIFKKTEVKRYMPYLNEIYDIWEMVKRSFNDNEKMPESVTELWFGELEIISFENCEIVFSTNSDFKQKIIKENYLSKIDEKFSGFLGFDVKSSIVFNGTPTDAQQITKQFMGKSQQKKAEEKTESEIKIDPQFYNNYNFEYTFDSFIVGNSNKFAHAACLAVAERPARDYNPLFIYGPSGLGKTHLMSAVVNEIKRKKADLKVVYIKGEDFTNQLIESLAKQEMHIFREKYRNCDILLIDDIQFIAGKNSTQEEFFHTFNALYEDHKQIILSSDRPPKDIQTLEERLKTRFEWGLIADIQPPDLELRIAIIKKKAEQISIELSDEVLNFIAENLRSNIRQIEGAVKKLRALSFINGNQITIEVAKGCLSELLGGAEPVNVTVDKIFTAVYKKYGIKKEDVIGQKRNKEIANARHICIYLIRTITEMSYPNIGKIFNRDHTTILASIDKIQKKVYMDPVFNIEMMEVTKEVTGV
ncbi:MAG: chromosomal replication initiator protein DnaA [Ruminococcaceae bacterium]|nr:chromosomal replication initiator protein DnaA [Oscillospiraceae bacterium]